MTDPTAYIDGQLDVFDVIALIDAEAESAAQTVLDADAERVRQIEEAQEDADYEYMLTQGGRDLSDRDEIIDHADDEY